MNKDLEKSIKELGEKNAQIVNTYAEYFVKNKSQLEKLFKSIAELGSSLAKIWKDNYEKIIKETNKIFSNFDLENIDEKIKDRCIFLVENGFYPYGKLSCFFEKDIPSICDMIEIDVIREKNRICKILPNYKKYITEIYGLFNQHRYRLCILSLINLLSVIFNDNFENKDFTEIDVSKLKKLKIITDKNQEFCIFIPYVIDMNASKKKDYKNKILVNSQENNYKDLSYNRNAILHGYYKDFGNRENCLRWFSVLLNTVDLIKIYNEIKEGVRK